MADVEGATRQLAEAIVNVIEAFRDAADAYGEMMVDEGLVPDPAEQPSLLEELEEEGEDSAPAA